MNHHLRLQAVTADLRVIDALGFPALALDAQLVTLRWNQEFLEFFPEHDGHIHVGEPYAENLRRFCVARLDPQERVHIDGYIAKGIERHRNQDGPFEFLHRGRWLRAEVLALPGGGKLRYWNPVSPPWNGDALAESIASSGEPVTEDVIEQIADGLVLRDRDGKIVLTNRRFAETYGLTSSAQAVGKSFPEILDLAWGRAAAAEEAQRCWVDNARYPGAPFELPLPGDRWVRVREHRTHGGSVLGTHVDLTDYHRLRRSESEARQRAEEIAARLAKEIEERERAQQQVIQAARLASLGEMATGLAHELNQPLAGISMAAENARRTLDSMPEAPSRLREKLSLIVDLTQRAAAIIDRMRIFGRSETLGRGPVAIGEVLTGAERLLADKLHGSGVRLWVSLAPELPPVLGKSLQLEQVIMNLISNACDAYAELTAPVPAERWHIGITAEANADWVTIEVQDAAGGIPPEVLPRVFEPFFTTKPVGQGTGLGLSISYGIVTDMGGTITAENAAGGCRMRILLPVAR